VSEKTAQAVALLQDVLQARTTQLGAVHPDTLATKHDLALVYLDWGTRTGVSEKTAQAVALLQDVLQAQTAQLGAVHPETLTSKHY
ncbi:hypothetical protein, partial [Salmonella sp. SAL4434]|uniref:hypothetical protein n=1 Tax=Salmonella sp. SAL4434 TaxID=3159889 RepID=UPI00397C51CE